MSRREHRCEIEDLDQFSATRGPIAAVADAAAQRDVGCVARREGSDRGWRRWAPCDPARRRPTSDAMYRLASPRARSVRPAIRRASAINRAASMWPVYPDWYPFEYQALRMVSGSRSVRNPRQSRPRSRVRHARSVDAVLIAAVVGIAPTEWHVPDQRTDSSSRSMPLRLIRPFHSASPTIFASGKRRRNRPMATCASRRANDEPRQ